MTVDTSVNTPASPDNDADAKPSYPKIEKLISALASEMRAECVKHLPADVQTRISAIDTALAGLAVLDPSLDFVKAASAAANVERDALMNDAAERTLASIHETLADAFTLLMPKRKPIVTTSNAPRERAGIATTDGNSVMTADTAVYRKHVLNREQLDVSGADDACRQIGCQFCMHAAKATSMKNYASYKATFDKLFQETTSDFVASHDACLNGVYLAGLNAFTSAVTYTAYVPVAR